MLTLAVRFLPRNSIRCDMKASSDGNSLMELSPSVHYEDDDDDDGLCVRQRGP